MTNIKKTIHVAAAVCLHAATRVIEPLIDVLDGLGVAAHLVGCHDVALLLNVTAFSLRLSTDPRVHRAATAAIFRAVAAVRRMIIHARTFFQRMMRVGWSRLRHAGGHCSRAGQPDGAPQAPGLRLARYTHASPVYRANRGQYTGGFASVYSDPRQRCHQEHRDRPNSGLRQPQHGLLTTRPDPHRRTEASRHRLMRPR
jgi:hypothetical protein